MGMMTAVDNPLHKDLDIIFTQIHDLWDNLRGQRIFITGGSGFIGSWLCESLVWADQKRKLGLEVDILTRNPDAFRQKLPHVASYPAINLCRGDICDFPFLAKEFAYVIHAAAMPSNRFKSEQLVNTFDTIVEGTRRALQFAIQCKAQKLLLISSGAVYGRQPPELDHVSEEFIGAPDCMDPRSAYGEGKRAAEVLAMLISRQARFEVKIARCFTFVGPYLPLDGEYAVGNFFRDGFTKGSIRVDGDGTPYRSFLYAADMAIWLWTILFCGKPSYPYNVGSEVPISIAQLAQLVADQFEPRPQITISKPPIEGSLPERYIPSTQRASLELRLSQSIDIIMALQRTKSFIEYQLQSTGKNQLALGYKQ